VTGSAVTERDVEQDTGCLVYAVVRPSERATLPSDGIDDEPLRLVAHGSVAAVVNDIALERPPGRRADLMAYSRVVDGLVAGGVVVPVRFGSVLPDEQSVVEEFLAPNERYFSDLFDQLNGRSQFNVRASYHGDAALAEIVAADPAVAELQARTRGKPEDAVFAERLRLGELVAEAMEAKRDFDAAVLCDSIVPLTVAHDLALGSGLEVVCDLKVLVDDDRRTEFEERLEDLAEAVHERLRLRLVGPVAPYDFVGDVSWV
jgi:hypothetical protein